MAGLKGLTGLYGSEDTAAAGTVDEGALQAYQQGIPYADAHGKPGDTSGQTYPAGYGLGYSGQPTYGANPTGQLAEFNDLPNYYVLVDPDAAIDRTPSTHGGLYPRPMALDVTAQSGMEIAGEQSTVLHGTDQGGPRTLYGRAPGGGEEPTQWTVDRYDSPNASGLSRAVPDQLKGSQGATRSLDIDQGYGVPNTNEEFTKGHSIRYVQHDRMHWDRSLTGPEPQDGVWLGRHPVGTQTTFDGPDSPYGVMGNNQRLIMAERRGYPTQYTQPSSPTVLAVQPGPQQDVWASNGVGGF